jgi:hypothetical protein
MDRLWGIRRGGELGGTLFGRLVLGDVNDWLSCIAFLHLNFRLTSLHVYFATVT